MTPFNLHAIPPIICAIIILSSGIIVFLKNKRNEINQTFLAICLLATFWLTLYSVNYGLQSTNPAVNENILRFGFCFVTLLPIAFLHYIATFVNLPFRKKLIIINYLYGILAGILILNTNLILNGTYLYFWGYYPKAGKFHPLYLIIFSVQVGYTFLLLINDFQFKLKNTANTQQTKYMFGCYAVFALACWDFVPNYGFEVYPFGYLPATIFMLIIFYAIFKHNLMDINIVINRSLVYSLLITTITIIYLLFVLLVERFSQSFFRYTSVIVSILSAIIIALIFVPLKDKIQQLVDHLFFIKSPFELANENQLLRAEVLKTEKLKSVAILASGMAHEIRNPLTALKTFSEYLPNKLDDKEFLKKFAKIVGSEVDRIDSLVTQLLEFAKPSPVQLQKTNINKLIRETLDFLSNKFIDHKIQVMPQLTAECDEPILVDPSKLRQVFLNLFLNATEAMKIGGKLIITTEFNTDAVSINITDTGCGISKENITHIFDPFFSTKDTGTGLGLPIIYGIIQEHGGEIKVASQIGKGTTFTITLPSFNSP